MELKRILCPTDLSEASAPAFQQAVALAARAGAELVVLYVASPLVGAVPGLAATVSGGTEVPTGAEVVVSLKPVVDAWCADVASPSARVHTMVEVGQPAARILEHAGANGGVSLIVMGTHGHGGFEHLLLGSVAEKVLRKADCPVLTVPPHASGTPKPVFSRVLCAVDFSEASLSALRAAASLAAEAHGELLAVHVLEWPWEEGPDPHFEGIPPAQAAALQEYRRYAESSALARLRASVTECGPFAHAPDVRVVHGRSYSALLTVAAGENVDVIVLGVRGRRALEVNMLGSTANQVVRRATCPVLTMRG